jgi:hypothetical protein
MQNGNICVLQHGQGGGTVHLQANLPPDRLIETLARSLDDSRPIWTGNDKVTQQEQVKREGRFASAVVAQFADEITGGQIRDAAALGDLMVTGYPQRANSQSIIVDAASQRVWVGPSDQSSGKPVPTGEQVIGFDDFITTGAKAPGDLAASLGLT